MITRTIRSVLIVLVLIHASATCTFGWGSLTHFSFGVASANGSEAFQNLPDTWPSHEWWHITEWFYWSHGVQSTGTALFGVPPASIAVPLLPTYIQVAQTPGEIMYAWCRRAASCTALQHSTALGFISHDAADAQVHWSFFEGGNATGWLRHVPKETWADYVVYLNQFNGGFDGRGKPTLQPALPNRGDASLIHTAQEEFGRRKLSLDATKQVNLPPVETPAAIDRRIQAHGTDMRDEVARMSRRGFNSYLRIAKELGWSVNELEQRYKTTSRVVSTVYQSHP